MAKKSKELFGGDTKQGDKKAVQLSIGNAVKTVDIQSSVSDNNRIVHRLIQKDSNKETSLQQTPLLIIFEDSECVLVKDENGKGVLLRAKAGSSEDTNHGKKIIYPVLDTVYKDVEWENEGTVKITWVYSKSFEKAKELIQSIVNL